MRLASLSALVSAIATVALLELILIMAARYASVNRVDAPG